MFVDIEFAVRRSEKVISSGLSGQLDHVTLAEGLQISQESPFDVYRLYILAATKPDIKRQDLIISLADPNTGIAKATDPDTGKPAQYRVAGPPRWYVQDHHLEMYVIKVVGTP